MKPVTHNAFVAAKVIGRTYAPATISDIRNVQVKTERWERFNALLENHQRGVRNQEKRVACQG